MTINTIAVLTSGGDSPGMNAAIRSVVRSALGKKWDVYGVKKGYSGLLANNFIKMDASSVGNIIGHGGTILQTSRCKEFLERKHRETATQILKDRDIDALVVIGGNGSFNGAFCLNNEFNFPVIGIPGTIDNDISGSDYTIGFDTAVETAVNAVDKIRDTAFAHDRTFLIEVMGRKSGAIALKVGICSGAENVLLPQEEVDVQKLSDDIRKGIRRGKKSSIIIVAEGKVVGRSYEIAKKLKGTENIQARVCVLGHIQRGGSPSPNDRFYAAQMGSLAIEAPFEGKKCHATVVKDGRVTLNELKNCLDKRDNLFDDIKNLTSQLSI